MAHLGIGNGLGKNGSELQEDRAALVEDLDTWRDFEVLAYGEVERVESWLRVPEEVWDVEDIGR